MDAPKDIADWTRSTAALRRVARAIVRDDHLSEDIVQGAYLTSLRTKASLRGEGWLRATVRSRAIDGVRKRFVAPRISAIPADEVVSQSEPTDKIAEHLEVQRSVLAAVHGLSSPYREVVYLRFFEDLTPTRIAERLGTPVKTVKTRLTRGLSLLRSQLQDAQGDSSRQWSPALIAFALDPSRSGRTLLLVAMKKVALAVSLVVLGLATWFFVDASRKGHRDQASRSESGASARAEREVADDLAPVAPSLGASERISLGPASSAPISDRQTSAVDAGSLRLRVVWTDGSNAADVGIIVSGQNSIGGRRPQSRQVTDQNGEVHFPALRSGTVAVKADLGSLPQFESVPIEAKIVAGEMATSLVVLPRGVTVTGVVVDESEDPVSDAEIWLTSGSWGWTSGRIVGRSGSFGRFEIDNVPPSASLAALYEGCAPGALVDLDEVPTEGSYAEIQLRVGGLGGQFKGTVSNAQGEPIQGAIVALGKRRVATNYRENGTVRETWGPRSSSSTEGGLFHFTALRGGQVEVHVRAPGFGQWSGSVDIDSKTPATLNLTLHRCARLRGTVAEANGRPSKGAWIYAFDQPLEDAFLQSRQIDSRSPFQNVNTRADQEGRFELTDLPVGTAWVYAQSNEELPSGTHLYERIELATAAEGEYQWNPTLSSGRSIHGRVRYRDGSPMKNVFVSAYAEDSLEERTINTGDGSFEFIHLTGKTYHIDVQLDDEPEGAEPLAALGVRPGDAPLDLVADFDKPVPFEPATVIARFEDSAGRAKSPKTVSMILETTGAFRWFEGEQDGATWTFTVHSPGELRPIAVDDERLIAYGEPFEVTEGGTHDLGTLRSGPGATLVLLINRPKACANATLRGSLSSDAVRRSKPLLVGTESEHRIEGLEPGSGVIELWGTQSQKLVRPYTVTAGEVTTVELDLVPAVRVPYTVHRDALKNQRWLDVRVIDRGTGDAVYGTRIENIALYGPKLEFKAALPIGTFTIVTTLGDGKEGRADFEIGVLDGTELPEIVIDLR